MNRKLFFVYVVCKPVYVILTPFVAIYDLITSMANSYPYALSDKHRKQLKSFGYNYRNITGAIGSIGCVLYVRYKLKLAKEGFDFI